jgi:tetratricopeptide (TPR) repeat protein
MRQLLETSMVNPRDADARYQLGLIYQQRRDHQQAKKCFEEAIAIDKQEAEPHYQLGRVLRTQGNSAEALEHLKTAAAIDNKLSQSEVLRETGATLLDLGRDAEARDILREYTNRRGFDAEGCYWYGVALSRLGENQAAKEALQQSIESVRTAPSHLRRQASKWESAARKLLRQL